MPKADWLEQSNPQVSNGLPRGLTTGSSSGLFGERALFGELSAVVHIPLAVECRCTHTAAFESSRRGSPVQIRR